MSTSRPRGKTTPASTAGSFTTHAHGTAEVDLVDGPSEDDLDFARETLGPDATDDEVYDLAGQRADRDAAELARERDEEAFNEPLDRARLLRSWEAEAEFRRLGPGDATTIGAGDGGVWRIHVGDHDPANTEACGIIESGQYTAVRLDADGNQTDDFLAEPFTDLASRAQAAARAADFIHRNQRATEQRIAREREAAQRDPLAAYEAARADVDHDWRLLTEGIEHLDPEARAQRYNDIAEHLETLARRTSIHTDPRDLPGPGETILNGSTGTIYAAADRAAEARRLALGQSTRGYEIDGAGDALAAKVFDTRDFEAANGVPFRARLVRKGEFYGRSGTLVAAEDTVMFFDARFPDHPPMLGTEHADPTRAERNGQFVTSYHVSALRPHPAGAGLQLAGDVAEWKIDGETLNQVMDWMDRRAPMRENPFASQRSLSEVDAAYDAARDQDPAGISEAVVARHQRAYDQAYATRLREITRGWDSVRKG